MRRIDGFSKLIDEDKIKYWWKHKGLKMAWQTERQTEHHSAWCETKIPRSRVRIQPHMLKGLKWKKERQFNVHEIIYKHKAGRENKEEKFAEKV